MDDSFDVSGFLTGLVQAGETSYLASQGDTIVTKDGVTSVTPPNRNSLFGTSAAGGISPIVVVMLVVGAYLILR